MRRGQSGSASRWRAAAASLATACGSLDSTLVEVTDSPAAPSFGVDPPPSSSLGPECPAPQPGSLGRESAALSVVDRSLVGSPARYDADPTLRAREPELASSLRARRAAAWEIASHLEQPPKAKAPVQPTPQS